MKEAIAALRSGVKMLRKYRKKQKEDLSEVQEETKTGIG
jgi:hypothetical protein